MVQDKLIRQKDYRYNTRGGRCVNAGVLFIRRLQDLLASLITESPIVTTRGSVPSPVSPFGSGYFQNAL